MKSKRRKAAGEGNAAAPKERHTALGGAVRAYLEGTCATDNDADDLLALAAKYGV